jgi:hypothetical protein
MFSLVGHNWPQRPLFKGMDTDIALNGDTQLSLDLPADVVDGDLLIIVQFFRTSSTINTPSGFTQKADFQPSLDGGTKRLAIYTKVASSETGPYTITVPSSDRKLGAILAYRYCHATQLDTVATGTINSSASSTSHAAPSVTPGTREALLLHAFGINRSGTDVVAQPTAPSGMTERVWELSLDHGLAIYDEILHPATATGTRTLTTVNNCASAAIRATLAKQ